MTPSPENVPAEIRDFCDRIAAGLEGLFDPRACIEFVQKELPDLLLNREFFVDLFRSVLEGADYPDVRRPTMFDNELILHIDSRRLFSLRMYLWGPGEYTVPHDHNSWGVLGTVMDGYDVINYSREDDGSIEGFACLVEVEKIKLLRGETACTLPLNEGIHKTGNPTREAAITLNLYGKSIPRGYINGFDVAHDRVHRLLPPRRKKEFLISQLADTLRKE